MPRVKSGVHSGQHNRKSAQHELSLPIEARASTTGTGAVDDCQIVPVGKRRDGGKRYWCLRHKADATAKYGRRASTCRVAHVPLVTERETLSLRLQEYPGGVALWGAVAPVYDTTNRRLDCGIHVHARVEVGGKKETDGTVRAVRLFVPGLHFAGVVVSELDAIYYMVSSVFGFETRRVECTFCGYPHLDRDWFSVHPHRRHLCAGCGKYFRDDEVGIGNPIQIVRAACGLQISRTKPAGRALNIKQAQYPGGIQIWGSNPAFLWTSPVREDEGIHIHAYRSDDDQEPVIDETYSDVRIDGVKLDARMVRVLMAQSALPHLRRRIVAADCPSCGEHKFCLGQAGYTPALTHRCGSCGREFSARGRIRKTIANPLPAVLTGLAQHSNRPPQLHDLRLLPETP